MAKPTIAIIKGVVTDVEMYQDREGKKKPHLKIDILQIVKGGSNVTSIKDMDLSAKYVLGQLVEIPCTASVWSFKDGKSGVTFTVFRGGFKDVSLNVVETLEAAVDFAESAAGKKKSKAVV